MLTQECLRELLHYDPNTGVFTWRVSRGSRKAGQRAGCTERNGYRQIELDGTKHKEHRLVFLYMMGEWPESPEIDHRNGERDDNRWENLRPATVSQNQWNAARSRRNSSGYKGVSYHKQARKWTAQIGQQRKVHYLGIYGTPQEAHAAYIAAAKELFGEYARLA